jgi:aryl sulfotransferase
MPITWLASYPKSGNTWLRFLLANILAGAPPRSSLDVSRLVHDIHRPDDPFEPLDPERLFIKTHHARTDRHPRIAETERAVHVVRHPRDVLLSALNYRRMEGVIDHLTDAQYAETFIANAGDPLWARLGYGSWAQHAASWTQATKFPVLTIRYEDLKSTPEATFAEVLGFIGLDATDDDIARAVKQSSFDNLRALEIREQKSGRTIFPGAAADARTKGKRFFFNSGATGQTLDRIAPGLDDAFDRRFAPALARLGY